MSQNNSIPVYSHQSGYVDRRGVTISDNRKRALFIGPKFTTYYYGKFSKIDQNNSASGFNLAAFFFGFLWFFYRKMYVYGSLVILLMLLVSVVSEYLELKASLFSLPMAIALGVYANRIYKVFVDQKIRKIESLQVADLEHTLMTRGRTSWIAAGGILLLMVMLLTLIFMA